MKVKKILKILLLSGFILSNRHVYTAKGDQDEPVDVECARALFTSPYNPNIKIYAHYNMKNTGQDWQIGFKISLYEAHVNNLKNNKQVGYIDCTTKPHAYIEILYVEPEERKKQYSRLLLQLALQEFANKGFDTVFLEPSGFEDVPTKILEQMYSRTGAKPSKHQGLMEYDISGLDKRPIKSCDQKALSDLMYHKKLFHAAKTNNLGELKKLLKDGVNPDSKDGDKDSMTALMHAARRGHLNIIKYLITEANANVNVTAKFKTSLLTEMIQTKQFKKADIDEVLRIGNFTPEIKEYAAFLVRDKRPDIAELINSYNRPKAKL